MKRDDDGGESGKDAAKLYAGGMGYSRKVRRIELRFAAERIGVIEGTGDTRGIGETDERQKAGENDVH